MEITIKRGDVVLVKLDPVMGSEQGKTRPCLVVQNDISNEFSPNTIIVPITSKIKGKYYPTEVVATATELGLPIPGTINCEGIRTISISDRIIKKIGAIAPNTMQKVDGALKTSLALA